MLNSKILVGKSILVATIVLGTFFCATVQVTAAESGCVTCHLDKEMLQKTGKVVKGAKSAMQSGAG